MPGVERILTRNDNWLCGAALYQIYPLSFQDSDGDGYGDLEGIVRHLGYVASLGVDGIWIAPFYPSPWRDFGYDVADYKAVDPRLGTLDMFDQVLAETHRLGLKVLVDLICGHTSTDHAWFRDSRRSRQGPRADWYVWADPAPDGTAPNNWLSVFGGPAWTWEPRRRQYYLHHFLPSQPSLMRSESVVTALLDAAEFWLEHGVDGFRLDAVDFLMRDPQLRPNPPVSPKPVDIPAKPFGMQHHIFDMAHPETRPVLERLRAVVDRYPGRVLLGKLSSQRGAAERIDRYTRSGGLDAAYTLDLPKRPFSAQTFHAALMAAGGSRSTCWSFSNHDVDRAASRWRPADADPARFNALLALLLCCMPGAICIYQGEELGLPQAQLDHTDLRDPFGLNFWPDFLGRDGCRTPMPWIAVARHGGFTAAAAPWLPLPHEHQALAADAQEGRTGSTLDIWRHCLALRRHHPALSRGDLGDVDEDGAVLAFSRSADGETLTAVFNLSNVSADYTLPPGRYTPVDLPMVAGRPADDVSVTLPPLGVWLARREPEERRNEIAGR
jgi:alpha-glucosidase